MADESTANRISFEKLMGIGGHATPGEVERVKAEERLRDQFQLEDATLELIVANMNRNRGLTYFDGQTLVNAFRVMKANHQTAARQIEDLKTENGMLKDRVSRLESVERVNLFYQTSMIRKQIKRITVTLFKLGNRLDHRLDAEEKKK